MPAPERFSASGDQTIRKNRAGGGSRRQRTDVPKYEARRQEIAHAAIGPLNRNGIRGMTMSQVGKQLGLAPTAIGYYFKGKEELAATCYLASVARLSRLIAEVEALPPTGRPQAFIRAFITFRRQVELGEEDEIAWFEDVRTIRHPEVDEAYVGLFRRLRALLQAESGTDRAIANIHTHQLISQLLWVVAWLPKYHPDDYDRAADRVIDILENGLAAEGRAWSPHALGEVLGDPDEGESAQREFLRAATDLINELGYLGASVQKISERVNVTKGSFYHHHSGKNDLVAQCFDRTWEVIRRAQSASDAVTDNGLDNLASLSAWLVEAHLTGATPMLRSAALAAAPGEMRPELVASFDRHSLRLSTVVSDGIADGSVRPVDATIAGMMLSGAINAGAELPFWAPGMSPAEATNTYLRALFEGMLPKS